MRRTIAIALLGILATTAVAVAEGWPQPAAGESKSGDIEILFTFDDGPSAKLTSAVLDILKQNQIHAVFFLVGNMVENQDKRTQAALKREMDEGHIIGNHTQDHRNECKGTDEAAAADLDKGEATIEKFTGWHPVWIRIPGGARCARVDKLLEERHAKHFHWDLDPQEWRTHNADKSVEYVTGELTRAHGRVVLLMHDIQPVTAESITRILAWIKEENARRAESHKHQIRILQAPEYAIEQFPPGLADWIDDATAGLRALPRQLATVLP